MSMTPERRSELARRRTELKAAAAEREACERAREWIRHQTDVLDAAAVSYRVEEVGAEVWDWIEGRFPIRRKSLTEAFIDWDAVPGSRMAEQGEDPAEWLAEVRRAEELGNPDVLVMWERDVAIRVRLADLVANAEILDSAFHSWTVCREGGWAVEFQWGSRAWGRACPPQNPSS